MSSDRATRSKTLYQITCIIERGKGDTVTRAAIKAGAGGATVFFARGTGTREKLGLLGLAIVPEKEVVQIVCREGEKDRIFNAIVQAGRLDVPGKGIAHITEISHVAGGNF